MTTTSNSLILSDGGFLIVITSDPESNIQEDHDGDYILANMDNKDEKNSSFYVIYDKVNFGLTDGNSTESTFVPSDIFSGSSDTVRLPYPAMSAQGFDNQAPGIILFQFERYVGNSQFFHTSRSDITLYFPTGVSSVIVTGGNWKLYGSKDFKPPIITINGSQSIGRGTYPAIEVDQNTMVRSVQYSPP